MCNELGSFSPAELLLGGDAETSEEIKAVASARLGCCMGRSREHQFDLSLCKAAVESQFGKAQDALGLTGHDEVIIAAGALLCALRDAQKNDLPHIRALDFYVAGKFMGLDLTARRNLELTETMRTKEKKGSLLGVLDQTKTAMGGRLLRSWMERPLLSPAKIGKRLSAVQELVDKTIDREELRLSLREVSDYERVMARIVTGTANCRDLVALSQGAATLPAIHDRLETLSSPLLKEIYDQLDPLQDLKEAIEKTIVDEPPFVLREGGMIRDGANEELDKLREIQNGGTGMLTAIEAREKEATGIRNLRVGYNRVFGYYIEVAKGQLNLVPDHYIRKQTLSTGERYITQELKELESTILGAKDRIVSLEYEIFTQLRAHVSEQSQRVQKTAQAIASLDVLCSFAHTAVHNHYCRPEVDLSGEIRITQGRHPVVEQMLKNTLFVPNDTVLGADGCKAAIITGPNMAGKSTYMRQVALIVLMAQMGSFVPAASARVGIVDKLFTRIGASDDLASGQSTFMVEMNEVADILKNATPRSLLILDEIGRGTSTFDGMAIAKAVLEYAVDPKKLGAKTLFATHYHELTSMEQEIPEIRNFNIAVKKRQGEMIFLRKIVPGAADDSYGVEVAKLAGLPDKLIARARAVLKELESGAPKAPAVQKQASDQVSLMDLQADEIREKLSAINVETLTPIEAMNILYQLKQLL